MGRARSYAWSVGVCLAASLTGGCTSAGSAAPQTSSSPTSVAATPTAQEASATCPAVSGQMEASAGPLRAGPFFESALRIPAAWHQAKLWVSSSRPGNDDAVVTVTDPDGHTTTTTRPGGEASVDNAEQFWPGGVEASTSGDYRVDIHVGSDRLCVTVPYSLS